MELDDDDDDDEEAQSQAEDQENDKSKTNQGRKRKSDAKSSTNPRKKRKTTHNAQKLKVKFGRNDALEFEVEKLQKMPYFEGKIVSNDDGSFKWKPSNSATFKSSEK